MAGLRVLGASGGGFVPPFFLGLTPKLAVRHRWRRYLLGTLLMARSGRSTRTVRIADRLTLCPSREYSIMLRGKRRGVRVWGAPCLGARAAWGWGAAHTE